MWYFNWILGIGLALAFGIINKNCFWGHIKYERQLNPGKRYHSRSMTAQAGPMKVNK